MRQLILGLFLLAAIPMLGQSTASAQVSAFIIDAPQLQGSRKIWVYLPKNYAGSDKKYPVLYLHDAQNVFDAKTSFAGEWNADETLDSLNAQTIVIGIEHGNDKRIDELTPYKNEKYGGGKADVYLDFMVHNLIPEINRRYRTKTGAKNTGIMGSSLGGLVSFYAVLKYPEVFGKAGVLSPSFWFSKTIYNLAQQTPKINAKIYFLCGDDEDPEMVPDLQRMVEIVHSKSAGKNIKSEVIKGGKHNEQFWRGQFAKAYLWLMK